MTHYENLNNLLQSINDSQHGLPFVLWANQSADIIKMQERGLVRIYSYGEERFCQIELLGKEFLIDGGFVGEAQREKESIQLEKRNKELNNETLEYQKKIRSLEEELKISSLLKNLWYLIGAAILLGIAIGKYLLNGLNDEL